MKRPILVMLTLFLLSACTMHSKDEPWKWVPETAGEELLGSAASYDPAEGISYEEYLTTVDAPIVVSFERISGALPLLELERAASLWNAPHVIDVNYPVLLHWLGDSIEESTLMIGQYENALKPEQLEEGRAWKGMTECCVNRALYDKLLADPEAAFSGLGDTATAAEIIYDFVYDPNLGTRVPKKIRSRTERSLTGVGIVSDEGAFSDPSAYGNYHLYLHLDMTESLLDQHRNRTTDNIFDTQNYMPARHLAAMKQEAVLFWRDSPEDPGRVELRLPGRSTISPEEWDARAAGIPVNAGYLVEVTLDSGRNYSEFLEYYTEMRFRTLTSARKVFDYQWANYQTRLEDDPNAQLILSQVLEEIYEDDELDDWYCSSLSPYVIRPLRIAGE